MPDAELATALKQAKSKKMFFAFVPKGADGKLIVSKTKIPPKLIAEAKKEIGGGNAVTGKCFGGDGGAMVFQVAKAAPPATAAAVKKVAKRDTGLTIDPNFQLAGDADADEQSVSVGVMMAPAAGTAQEDAADDDAQSIGEDAEAAEEEADAAALQAKAAADKAQIMQRLTALVGPYKEAVANNGPNVKRLQALLAAAKTAIAKQQFTQAGEGLDMLEDLLAEKPTPSPDVTDEDDDLNLEGQPDDDSEPSQVHGMGVDDSPDVPPHKYSLGVDDSPHADDKEDADDTASADGDTDDVAALDLGPWQAARLSAVDDLKAFASKVAATKHGHAVGVLKEINSIITKLPAQPGPSDLDKLEDFVRNDETITAAEAMPAHFHELDIREPLLKALAAMRQ
jgi:hypothetical protein